MTTEQLDVKIKELTGELEKADTELSKLRPQVQYLEAMQHRLGGALQILQDLLTQEKQATVTAQPAATNSHGPLPVGA